MKEIIVGYDASEESERAVRRAAEVAEAFASRLVVVSVTKPVADVPSASEAPRSGSLLAPGVAGSMGTPGTESHPATEIELERSASTGDLAERQLEDARVALAGRSLDVEFVSALGTPAERVLDMAESRDSDLIVVGSRDHGFLERLFTKPLDETVARRASMDVLLVH